MYTYVYIYIYIYTYLHTISFVRSDSMRGNANPQGPLSLREKTQRPH